MISCMTPQDPDSSSSRGCDKNQEAGTAQQPVRRRLANPVGCCSCATPAADVRRYCGCWVAGQWEWCVWAGWTQPMRVPSASMWTPWLRRWRVGDWGGTWMAGTCPVPVVRCSRNEAGVVQGIQYHTLPWSLMVMPVRCASFPASCSVALCSLTGSVWRGSGGYAGVTTAAAQEAAAISRAQQLQQQITAVKGQIKAVEEESRKERLGLAGRRKIASS